MSNEFSGTGNVGDLPLLKTVMVGSEERQVAELRVFFDEYRQDGKGGLEQAGGFWLDVNVWGDRHAPEVAQIVKKGARACRRSARRNPVDCDGYGRGAQRAASECRPSVLEPHTAGRGQV